MGLRICISTKFPGDMVAAGQGTMSGAKNPFQAPGSPVPLIPVGSNSLISQEVGGGGHGCPSCKAPVPAFLALSPSQHPLSLSLEHVSTEALSGQTINLSATTEPQQRVGAIGERTGIGGK